MVWRIENIEGAIAQLVVGKLSALKRILFVHNDETARHRHGTD